MGRSGKYFGMKIEKIGVASKGSILATIQPFSRKRKRTNEMTGP